MTQLAFIVLTEFKTSVRPDFSVLIASNPNQSRVLLEHTKLFLGNTLVTRARMDLVANFSKTVEHPKMIARQDGHVSEVKSIIRYHVRRARFITIHLSY